MQKIIISIGLLLSCWLLRAQIGVNTTTPQAQLDIESSESGLLIPRVALTISTQSLPVTNPNSGNLVNSTLIYNTSNTNDVTPGFYYWLNDHWERINNEDNFWKTTGNAGTDENINFIGTTDNHDLRFHTNNILRATVHEDGRFSVNAMANPRSDDMFFVQGNTGDDAITGYTSDAIGVHGEDFDDGVGVLGRHSNGFGYGVYGQTLINDGVGVYGREPSSEDYDMSGFAILAQGDLGRTGGSYNLSDRKLKYDIKDMQNALQIIKQLKAKEYYYDTEKYKNLNLSSKKQYGFIAQEVKEILPEITASKTLPNHSNIEEDDELATEEVLMMDYSRIIPILTKAMNEQQDIIESQEERIAKLEAQMQTLLAHQ